MKAELDEALVRDFPLLYGNRHAPMQKTCMCWGFECGDGWELSAKIEPIIAAMPVEEQPNFRASQVKEKFGTLRFYMTMGNDAIWAAIDEADAKSAVTCECCGKPGSVRGGGWIKVQCDACHGGSDVLDPTDLP
jgi:hypothetical protein